MSFSPDFTRRLYGLGWLAARPLLARNARLRDGWDERVLTRPLPKTDVWLHAASGGEAYLAETLAVALEAYGSLRILATTNTLQGRQVLDTVTKRLRETAPSVTLLPAYMPLDAPRLMRTALDQVAPKAVALLETELWPGLMDACAERGTSLLVVNGRMRPRSLAGYLGFADFFRRVAPARALAVSKADAMRYGLLFGAERAQAMPNMKFDRLAAQVATKPLSYARNPLASLVRAGAPLLVLGSVRAEEEDAVAEIIARVLAARPRTLIGLFPRHMHRVAAWIERLSAMGLPHGLRSTTQGYAAPGTVLVWDAFGELGAAYHLARAAFVGGSLAPLGGQNVLEPPAAGVAPVSGPSLYNFSWAAPELHREGLLTVAADAEAAAMALLHGLLRPRRREAVRMAFAAFVNERCGGAALAATHIAKHVGKIYKSPTSQN